MILLSNTAVYQKTGGQALVGGMDVEVCRNFFGSQVQSFEMKLDMGELGSESQAKGEGGGGGGGGGDPQTAAPDLPANAVFIRAPAVLKCGAGVKVLARVKAVPCASALESLRPKAAGPDGDGTAQKEPATDTTLPGSARPAVCPDELRSEEHALLFKRRKLSPSELQAVGLAKGEEPWDVAVAVRQGNLIATAFHPEFTQDLRWHRYFVDICKAAKP